MQLWKGSEYFKILNTVKPKKNRPMGLYISKAFFWGGRGGGGGGELIFVVGKDYIREGLIIGVKNKLRNAWGYTRGKNSC